MWRRGVKERGCQRGKEGTQLPNFIASSSADSTRGLTYLLGDRCE